jgi:hypothetical protein
MKIPLPERGQPIDLNYLYQIANSINNLSNQISTSNTTSVIDNGFDRREDITTNKLRFYATTKKIVTGNISQDFSSQGWSVDLQPDFLFTPVVVATVVNNTASPAGNNVTLVIGNITTNRVEGNIIYNKSGNIDININVIAIGVSR